MLSRPNRAKLPRMNLKAADGPFAPYIKRRRMEMGLTQRELAELSGLSFDFVQAVERGSLALRLSKLVELLAALGGEIHVRDREPDPAGVLDELSRLDDAPPHEEGQ